MSENTLVGLMLDGGWVMWAVLSLASLAVVVERSWVLRRARVPVPHLAEALGRTLGSASFPAAALEAVQRAGSGGPPPVSTAPGELPGGGRVR